jgi:hypothetical protein
MVDVATGWSERFAVLGRSYRVMENAFRAVLARLPFPVLEIHPDNGSEFFNAHLLSFWEDKVQGVHLSRSRPYQKNDNRIVEQKNSSLIRQYLGNDRLDTVAQVLALNEVYVQMGLYYNLFQPVLHLLEKTWCPSPDGHAGRVQRRYDAASTPFDRLCRTGAIKLEDRQVLLDLRQQINPRVFRQQFYNAIDAIFLLPEPDSSKTENIFKTLEVVPSVSIGTGISVTLSFDLTRYYELVGAFAPWGTPTFPKASSASLDSQSPLKRTNLSQKGVIRAFGKVISRYAPNSKLTRTGCQFV